MVESGARTKAGAVRAQGEREGQIEAQIEGLIPLDELDSEQSF
jgi:hypothetical protein